MVDMKKGAFSNNPLLQAEDFQAPASKTAAMVIGNTPDSQGCYSKALAWPNFIYLNKAGLTQFRLRFAKDDNNDGLPNYLTFSYPLLVIRYYFPQP